MRRLTLRNAAAKVSSAGRADEPGSSELLLRLRFAAAHKKLVGVPREGNLSTMKRQHAPTTLMCMVLPIAANWELIERPSVAVAPRLNWLDALACN